MEKSYDLLVADRGTESVHFLKTAFEHEPANHELGLLLAEVYFQIEGIYERHRMHRSSSFDETPTTSKQRF